MNATKKKAMSNIANRHAMAGKIMSDAYKDIMAPLDPIDNEPINDDSGIPSKNQSELDKMSKELDDILNGL